MLRTIGEACPAVKRERLERLVDWVVDKLDDDDWSLDIFTAVHPNHDFMRGRYGMRTREDMAVARAKGKLQANVSLT